MSSVESQFLETNDFSEFEGEWVAILDKKIVAHGKTLVEVYDKVEAIKLVRTPLFHRIPKKDEIDTFIL
jgi:hypothetical protein